MSARALVGRGAPVRATGTGGGTVLALALVVALAGCERPPEPERAPPVLPPASLLDDRFRTAAGEDLHVERIVRVGGFAYTARISGKVAGLRDGGDGRNLRLVEDGVPLGPAGALSADVVELGHGRFNHETAARILFSASDNSDPRRNRRVYRVEWDEPAHVTPRSAPHTIGIGKTRVVVAAAKDRPIASRRLVIENLDAQRAVRLWGRPVGAPDLTTRDAIVASVVAPWMSAEDKALALWALMTSWRHHDVAAAAGLEAADPVKLLGVYGFGFCNDVAHALASLLERAGIRARVVAWDQHSVVEARFDDRWHLLDADLGRVYRTASGHLASVAEVFARHATAAFSPIGALPLDDEPLNVAYPRRADRVYLRALGTSAHALRPVLEPGDAVVFDFARGDRLVDRFSHDRPRSWPIRFANGTLRRKVVARSGPSCRVARVAWPYPIVGVQLSGRGLDPGIALVAQVRADAAASWQDLRVERVAREATASADGWLARGPIRYGLEARICAAGSAALDPRAEVLLDVVFQFAPRVIPSVGYGTSAALWTVEDATPGTPPRGRFAGVRVTQEWDELAVSSELDAPRDAVIANLDGSFVSHEDGPAYTTALWLQLPPGAGLEPRSEPLLISVLENGLRLGPEAPTGDEVASGGRGRFALVAGRLFFSASDGTDPRTNGRIYSVVLSPAPGGLSPLVAGLPGDVVARAPAAGPGRSSSTYSRPLARGSLPSELEK